MDRTVGPKSDLFPDFESVDITDRVAKVFASLLSAYNSFTDTENGGNIELQRILFIYTQYRLGVKGYRIDMDDFGALLMAIRDRFKEQQGTSIEGTMRWLMVVYLMLKDHVTHYSLMITFPEVPSLGDEYNKNGHSQAMMDRNKRKFLRERRPDVIKGLRLFQVKYAKNELEQIDDKSKHIAQPKPGQAPKSKKRKTPPEGSPSVRDSLAFNGKSF